MKKLLKIGAVVLVCLCIVVGCLSEKSADHTGQVQAPEDVTALEGQSYDAAAEAFAAAGFKNIRLEKEEDLIIGWLTKDGEIKTVTVDGENNFFKGDWFEPNVPVVITYHTFAQTGDEAPADEPGTAEQPADEETAPAEPSEAEQSAPAEETSAAEPAEQEPSEAQTAPSAPRSEAAASSAAGAQQQQSAADAQASASVTVPDAEESEGNLVWVPVHGGTKYHRRSGCSNMEDPMQVTVETALANGYTPCKRCYG